jgi:hypothetical protein
MKSSIAVRLINEETSAGVFPFCVIINGSGSVLRGGKMVFSGWAPSPKLTDLNWKDFFDS